jgi:hypothetical protein
MNAGDQMLRLFLILFLVCLPVLATGCGSKAMEGSAPVPSSDVFKHNKGVKSPPPKKPPG